MAQFARPDSNVTQTSFTGGFADIDESSASDADFAFGANNTAAELEVGLTNVSDPVSSSGHTFRYRIAKTNAGVVDGGGNSVTVTARLMQGAAQIATDTAKTADGTWTQYSFTLSAAEADSITDYTDLRLEFVTSVSGGSPANRRGGGVSWAEFEVPDASLVVSTNLLGPDTTLFGPSNVHLTIFSNFISASTTLFDPQAFHVTFVVAQLLTDTVTVHSPNAIHAVAMNLLTDTVTLFQPSAIHVVQVNFISSGTSVFNPSTTYVIIVEFIGNTLLFNPVVDQGGLSQSVGMLLLNSASALPEPSISMTIFGDLIVADTLVRNPGLLAEAVVIATALDTNTALFTPSISGGQQALATAPYQITHNITRQLRRGTSSGLTVTKRLGN